MGAFSSFTKASLNDSRYLNLALRGLTGYDRVAGDKRRGSSHRLQAMRAVTCPGGGSQIPPHQCPFGLWRA